MFAVDELDRFTTSSWMPHGLEYLVNQGRHVQVSIIATSRRPQQIPREFSSQAHAFYVFRMSEPRDLAYVSEYLGDSTAARLPGLAQFTYLHWEEASGVLLGDMNGRETPLATLRDNGGRSVQLSPSYPSR
jgi:hypothetical protein